MLCKLYVPNLGYISNLFYYICIYVYVCVCVYVYVYVYVYMYVYVYVYVYMYVYVYVCRCIYIMDFVLYLYINIFLYQLCYNVLICKLYFCSDHSQMAYNSTEQLTNLDTEDYILITMYGIIFFVGVFGNATVIYVFKFKYGETLTTVQTQIFYLAVSDLFGSIINPFLFIYWQVTLHKKMELWRPWL